MLIIEDHKPLKGPTTGVLGTTHVSQAMVMYAENLSDLVSWLRDTPKLWSSSSSTRGADDSFFGGASWSQALHMAANGWEEGVDKLHRRLTAVAPPRHRMHKVKYGVAGDYPDISRFVAGDPLHMKSRGKDGSYKPVLHLVVCGNASGAVRADEMMNYGVAMASMVDRLENSGRRVELDTWFFNAVEKNNALSSGWNVKHADAALDLGALAFSLTHPCSFRRFGFAMLERTPKAWEHYGYGYGLDIQPACIPHADERSLVIKGVGHAPGQCRTVEGALKLASKQINDAAGEVIVEMEDD